jgi:hypothetical protein
MKSLRTASVKTDNKALRYNDGKPQFHLIPPEALFGLAEHFTKGAEKYEPHNWERGMDWSKCFDSLQRHCWAWQSGEDLDPENGAHHMMAAAWNALALYVYAVRNVGVDDRVKLGRQAEAQQASKKLYSEGLTYAVVQNQDGTYTKVRG